MQKVFTAFPYVVKKMIYFDTIIYVVAMMIHFNTIIIRDQVNAEARARAEATAVWLRQEAPA